jgi:uncharacterized protein YbaR (Trm112 family)
MSDCCPKCKRRLRGFQEDHNETNTTFYDTAIRLNEVNIELEYCEKCRAIIGAKLAERSRY